MKHLRYAVSALLLLATSMAGAQEPSAMVTLGGATFMMGTDPARIDPLMARFGVKRRELFAGETPAHSVTLQPFLIDRTEVINADYRKWAGEPFAPEDGELPATFITWDKAVAYCTSVGKRLPTEAEWEFAAGGGTPGEFPWGDEMPDPAKANWLGSGVGKPMRVASYPPNRAGLHDMAGNVWEFVQDEWRNGYSAAPDSSTDRRVIRGGSFGGSPVNLRVRYRDSHPANGAGPHVGFRCARSQ